MNRLQSEWLRLFILPDAGEPSAGHSLIDAQGRVRALVVEVAQPADWAVMSAVWHGVQDDLGLPPPGIAVSGTDGLQLWLSLAEPVDGAGAAAFMAGLRARYLSGVAPARVRSYPSDTAPPQHTALVPAEQGGSGNWSAFVAPGLAPVFADTPWLDIAPGIEAQADLLARLECIKPAAFEAAIKRLQPAGPPAAAVPVAVVSGPPGDVDPRRFLQRVLNDESAPLALRVEAAKALLAGSG